METRSSQSITAVLKDFVLGTFQQCQSGIVTHVRDDATGADLTGNLNVASGTSLHDQALVTGTAGVPTPTGTVDFQFFNNDSCSGTPVAVEAGIGLSEITLPTATTGGVAEALSSSRIPLPGSYSYNAKYNGDSRYPPSGVSACEPFAVAQVASSVDTRILLVGNGEVTNQVLDTSSGPLSVVDEATVTCNGFTPTGGVTFTFFSTADCSGQGTVDNCGQAGGCPLSSGVATSGQHSVTNGVFSFNALYHGDNDCFPSQTSSCDPVCGLPFKH